MGIVDSIFVNSMGEVTHAIVMKRSNREFVKRHVTALIIPILSESTSNRNEKNNLQEKKNENLSEDHSVKPKRLAAFESEKKTRSMLHEGLA